MGMAVANILTSLRGLLTLQIYQVGMSASRTNAGLMECPQRVASCRPLMAFAT